MNIETTADGSLTLYREDLDEHYHSVKGALTESLHVYVNMGWKEYITRNGVNRNPASILPPGPLEDDTTSDSSASANSSVRVFEVGFGTGLNAALTAGAAREAGVQTEYFAVELYPIAPELSAILLKQQSEEHARDFKAVNDAPWNQDVRINPWFKLHKISADLLRLRLPEDLNVIYFDAFAPEKQPELWSEAIFRKIFEAMAPGAILTTYCAKGAIRRLLQQTGYRTERLPGPPAGKREILRATKP